MKLFSRLILEKFVWVASIGTLLALLGGYFSIQLYKNLRTDIEELLPTTSRSVQDLDQVTHRLESIENIVVLVFSKNTDQSKHFVTDLAKRLETAPKNVVSSVEYRINREIEFFKTRQALYLDMPDLIKLKNYIQNRISYEKELYNPLNIFSEEEIPEPKFDFDLLQKKYSSRGGGYDHLPGGYYATQNELVRLLVVFMPGKGLENASRLKNKIETEVKDLNPRSYASDLEVKYTGNVENLIEESAALVADLEFSTVIVVLLVTLAMILFFRSTAATIALVASLLMGTFWAFGISYFWVGYLNANTAFLASIVFGNGINFGIIFLARYIEDRREGLPHTDAIQSAMTKTYIPTLTAALAAALSYGSLMLTGFRGFNQFGVIGLIGMIFCWISAYTLLPSYLTLFERVLKPGWISYRKPWIEFAKFTAFFVKKCSWIVCACTCVGIVLSILSLKNYRLGVIETDLSKLRDKRSFEQGSGALYHYIDDIFQRSFSPMVILPGNRAATRKIASLLKKEQNAEGKEKLISSVQILDDFIPNQQEQKIKVLTDIQKLLPSSLISHLSVTDQLRLKEFLNPNAFTPFQDIDLPPLILNKFREKDGTYGKIVLVDKVIEHGTDDSRALVKFVKVGRSIVDSVAPQTPVAGQLPISYDMFDAIVRDGPRATLCALLSVVFLVLILFRNYRSSGLILFALALGVIWFTGIILALRLKINFLNFIALPITFGIGVDYGVNIFKRYEEEGRKDILKVIQNTGGAVMLSSLTTIIGYSSLLIAGNQAFVSFGKLAVLGECTCVLAAVVALPAFLQFKDRSKKNNPL